MKKKRSPGSILAIFTFCVFLFCVLAFLVWLFWNDIEEPLESSDGKTASEPARKPPKEKILEEERKELDKILKRRR